MSFIYDDQKLMERLLLSGLDHAVKFTKKGQAAAAAVQQDRANLLGLIRGLQDQINPAGSQKDPNAGPEISYEGDNKPTMDSRTLESLGDLVTWLIANKVTVNGQRVAYDTDPGNKDYVRYRLETHMANLAERDANPKGYFVNLALLKPYIVSLQAYEQKNPNPTMRFQLGRLIAEANRDLGADISEKYQEPDKVLPDTAILDDVPHTFMDEKQSLIGGEVPLTYGDMKDDMSFNKWLTSNSISEVSKANDNQPIGVNNPNFDRCLILNILAARAKRRMSGAQDAAGRERATIYLRQVSSVAQEAGCDLSGRGQGGSGDQQGGQGKGQGGGLSASQQRDAVNEIVDTRPFDLQNIDFTRINTFFDKILQLSPGGAVQKTISDVRAYMQQASALTANGEDHFALGIPAASIINMLKPNPRTGMPAANLPTFALYLRKVLDGTRAVYDHFYQQWYSVMDPNRQALAAGQVGARPGDDSIYKQNLTYLDKWNLTAR